ncbi:hypothetical protein KY345_01430 [Candidatus Woesearchaeota archaeon]|nr:hypothetical protein [Candidatus Woesearchaeota archaeon]
MRKLIALVLITIAITLIMNGCAQPPADKTTEEKAEAEEITEEKTTTEVTQEDLDKLKADLEAMEFEDLGGLSE